MTATHGVGTYGNAVGTVTPLDHKMAQLGLVVKTAANTIRPGLFWDGSATVVSGTANMSYNVRAFSAVTSRGATAGAVLLTNDATYNVSQDVDGVALTAPGSNSRYDVVFIWQREYVLDGTNSEPVIGVVRGTAAASPSVPSLSSYPGAIELARILVPAGVTATNSGTTFTQTAPFTSVDGNPVVVRTSTEMSSYTPLDAGSEARNLGDGITYRWDGSAWKPWSSLWITWSTAPTNLTVGTGGAVTSTQRYRVIGGRYFFQCRYVLGTSGASVGTGPVINLPFSVYRLTSRFFPLEGTVGLFDTSTFNQAYGRSRLNLLTDNQVLIAEWSAGAYVAITATSPWTWAAGDEIGVEFWADPA